MSIDSLGPLLPADLRGPHQPRFRRPLRPFRAVSACLLATGLALLLGAGAAEAPAPVAFVLDGQCLPDHGPLRLSARPNRIHRRRPLRKPDYGLPDARHHRRHGDGLIYRYAAIVR